MSHSAARRDAGRLTRSSRRAAAQPNALCRSSLMPDHAVGGVDRLVERAADEAAKRRPQDRRDDAVGEILRQAFDRRACDAGLVQHVRIAADDLRDRATALVEIRIESIRDRAHMGGEAALRRETRGEKRKRGEAERSGRDAHAGRRPGDKRDRREVEARVRGPPPHGARQSWRRRD